MAVAFRTSWSGSSPLSVTPIAGDFLLAFPFSTGAGGTSTAVATPTQSFSLDVELQSASEYQACWHLVGPVAGTYNVTTTGTATGLLVVALTGVSAQQPVRATNKASGSATTATGSVTAAGVDS